VDFILRQTQATALNQQAQALSLISLLYTLSKIKPFASHQDPFSPISMSDNASNNSLTSSNFQADTTKYSSSKTADPETVSIATVSSSTPLVKKEEEKEKNGTEIDVKKLQEQALKSQIRFSM
jgi:hypothetical protein